MGQDLAERVTSSVRVSAEHLLHNASGLLPATVAVVTVLAIF
ncbi:MAG TPA: hypothetical protein VMO00_07550 [Methylomirabilota bacterium]|nr:hypothetical protein [Methylomirabilota bacterium]